MDSIKIAQTEYPVVELIRKRWSPRSFDGQVVAREDLFTILEAAGWAASAVNEQPWQYFYAFRDTDGFDRIFSCLAEGNQIWVKNVAVLIVAVARKTYEKNQKENQWAVHDLGMANAQLLLQATSMGIYGHAMGGFDKQKIEEQLSLNKDQEPVCVIALGYPADPDLLEEPLKSREKSPRTRKKISEIAIEV